eukprot:gnl/TRDRNA2_/TRDRNA2_130917_c0_seq4.p1 gnl/TRDRNA2_/TRDRNA2_130917_c0~~gnl/TRDRNA2_/TRDRNA2_130917_c0_seq4.p1  ORF type:complete len:340 (+),score=21.29 gnl/TRDRNA2_/TRDRNA2_130917_c0_seq4:145-1164(+)
MMWVQLGGHFRTMDTHIGNTLSFLNQSSRCWFVLMTLRSRLDSGRYSDDASTQTVIIKAHTVQDHLKSNAAFVVAHRKFALYGVIDTFHSGNVFRKQVMRSHGIESSRDDLVFLSRPDIVFSHAIQTEPLHALAKKGRRFSLLMQHDNDVVGGCDPTEVFAFITADVWDATLQLCAAHAQNGEWQACPGHAEHARCGPHGYRHILSEVTGVTGAEVYYIGNPAPTPFFHRLSFDEEGRLDLSVNRPSSEDISVANHLTMSLHEVRAPVDISSSVRCVYQTPESCSPKAAQTGPLSKYNVSTSLVRFECGAGYGGGRTSHGAAYLCDWHHDLANPEVPEV